MQCDTISIVEAGIDRLLRNERSMGRGRRWRTHAEGDGGAQDLCGGVRPLVLHLLPLLRRERRMVICHPHVAPVVAAPQRVLRQKRDGSCFWWRAFREQMRAARSSSRIGMQDSTCRTAPDTQMRGGGWWGLQSYGAVVVGVADASPPAPWQCARTRCGTDSR